LLISSPDFVLQIIATFQEPRNLVEIDQLSGATKVEQLGGAHFQFGDVFKQPYPLGIRLIERLPINCIINQEVEWLESTASYFL
jgi:hypothetical protein